MFAPAFMLAQENTEETFKPERTLSVSLGAANTQNIGLQVEATSADKIFKLNSSSTVRLTYGVIYKESGIPFTSDFVGQGIVVAIGKKLYFNREKWSGFYIQNEAEFASIKFKENIDGYQFEGTYSYISLISPTVGYKIRMGNFSIDPMVGFQWVIEKKGKGVVDNKEFDNTAFKAGLQIGYTF